MKITNNDLYKQKYDMSILELNICNLRAKTILNTQVVDAKFCAKYILNDAYYEGFEEDYFVDFDYVLNKQPHIKKEDLEHFIRVTFGAHY